MPGLMQDEGGARVGSRRPLRESGVPRPLVAAVEVRCNARKALLSDVAIDDHGVGDIVGWATRHDTNAELGCRRSCGLQNGEALRRVPIEGPDVAVEPVGQRAAVVTRIVAAPTLQHSTAKVDVQQLGANTCHAVLRCAGSGRRTGWARQIPCRQQQPHRKGHVLNLPSPARRALGCDNPPR